MKRIKQALLSTLTLATLVFTATAPSFATLEQSYYPLTATPLPTGSTVQNGSDTVTATDDAPTGDWTTTSSTAKNVLYELTLPSNLTCMDGSGAPMVERVGSYSWTTAANPISGTDENTAFSYVAPNSGIYATVYPGGGGGNSSDTDVTTGYSGSTLALVTPLSIVDFNTSGSQRLIGVSTHYSNGTEYTVTTKIPYFEAKLSCQVAGGTAAGGLAQDIPGTTPPATSPSAKSPKTGAGEVLIGTFLVALAATSFIVYKAIQKHRKTAELSEK